MPARKKPAKPRKGEITLSRAKADKVIKQKTEALKKEIDLRIEEFKNEMFDLVFHNE